MGEGNVSKDGSVDIDLKRPLIDGEDVTVEVTDGSGNTGKDTITAGVQRALLVPRAKRALLELRVRLAILEPQVKRALQALLVQMASQRWSC